VAHDSVQVSEGIDDLPGGVIELVDPLSQARVAGHAAVEWLVVIV
jgi:hypothetical protein